MQKRTGGDIKRDARGGMEGGMCGYDTVTSAQCVWLVTRPALTYRMTKPLLLMSLTFVCGGVT